MLTFWYAILFIVIGIIVGLGFALFVIYTVIRSSTLPYSSQKQPVPVNTKWLIGPNKWTSFAHPVVPKENGHVAIYAFRSQHWMTVPGREEVIQYLIKQRNREVKIVTSNASGKIDFDFESGANVLVKSLGGRFYLTIELTIIDTTKKEDWESGNEAN